MIKSLIYSVLLLGTTALPVCAASMGDVQGLIKKAGAQLSAGHSDDAQSTLKEARVLAQTISPDEKNGPMEALHEVVSAQSQAGFYGDAQISVETFPDPYNQALALSNIAHDQALKKQRTAALETYQQAIHKTSEIAVLWPRALVLLQIAHFQLDTDYFDDARRTASLIPDARLQEKARSDIAKADAKKKPSL
jgi:hypothetical protein